MSRMFRDPVSGLSHLAGAFAGGFGLIYLLGTSAPGAMRTAAFGVYGVSMILLYGASAAYHLLHVSAAVQLKLRRFDHAMVPVFIAGTYTPYCVLALHDTLGYAVLGVIWTLALAGLVKSLYWIQSPRWVTAGVYVVMGWVVVVAIYPLSRALSNDAMWLIVGGGLFYSIGALIYSLKRPNPWPPHFGFHEVWHLFVLAGSTCHYLSILSLR